MELVLFDRNRSGNGYFIFGILQKSEHGHDEFQPGDVDRIHRREHRSVVYDLYLKLVELGAPHEKVTV